MAKITIRDLIVNGLDEARLCNRNQPVNASLFLSAYTLLQKRLNQYSNTNLLSFVRKEIDIKPKQEVTVLGEYEVTDEWIKDTNFFIADNYDKLPNVSSVMLGSVGYIKEENKMVYLVDNEWHIIDEDPKDWDGWVSMPDIEVSNIQNIVRCYKKYGTEWVPLNFVSYEDFYNYQNNSEVYTVLPTSDTSLKFIIKSNDIDADIKLMYNERFDYNQDSELRIPQQYVSLFTAGLVYDLACQYPRMSDNTVALLRSRLEELEENVRTSSSVNKFIARPVTRESLTYEAFKSGRFLGL